jgi:hypothetical protein
MEAEAPRPQGLVPRLKRVLLVLSMAVVGLNIWTGSPLLALWLGSRVQGESSAPSMGAVGIVVFALGAFSLTLMKALSSLGRAYDKATGQEATVRQHVPWLRSMRGERERYEGVPVRLSPLEIVMVVMVIIAVIAFEIWFFFFSGSSIGQGSGR